MRHFKPIVLGKYDYGSDHRYIVSRAYYYVLFKFQNPIAWLLLYRWWLIATLTKEQRLRFFKHVAKVRKFYSMDGTRHTFWEEEFALRQPYLFPFVLFYLVFIKKLTCTREVIGGL